MKIFMIKKIPTIPLFVTVVCKIRKNIFFTYFKKIIKNIMKIKECILNVKTYLKKKTLILIFKNVSTVSIYIYTVIPNAPYDDFFFINLD